MEAKAFNLTKNKLALISGTVSIVLFVAILGWLRQSSNLGDPSLLKADDLIRTPSREVSIFYPAFDAIVEERRIVSDDRSPELAALRVLFARKPRISGTRVSLPPATVRSVKISRGLATVDFSRSILARGASKQTQRTALVAILYTLRQFPRVEKVRFTVEGRTSGRLGGKDVSTFWGDVTLKEMPWTLGSRKSTSARE